MHKSDNMDRELELKDGELYPYIISIIITYLYINYLQRKC